MNVSVPLHPGPGPRAHLPLGDQVSPLPPNGVLWHPGTQWPKPMSRSLGEGRRPGEWIKGVGEDVTLDSFNGT